MMVCTINQSQVHFLTYSNSSGRIEIKTAHLILLSRVRQCTNQALMASLITLSDALSISVSVLHTEFNVSVGRRKRNQ